MATAVKPKGLWRGVSGTYSEYSVYIFTYPKKMVNLMP